MEPCVLVSVPVAVLEVVPELGVAVPWVVLPCVPAVEPVPETDPDCVVPVSLDDAVRVLLLLLLQPKTSAAASARPYAYFIVLPPQRGFRGAPSEAPHQAPGSPRLLRRGRHRAVAMEASRTHGLSCIGRARRRCARTLSELPQHLQHGAARTPIVSDLWPTAGGSRGPYGAARRFRTTAS